MQLRLCICALVVVGALISCGTPLVELHVGRTRVEPGVAISVRLSAQGRGLERVIVYYGDGHSDTARAYGAARLATSLLHTYETPGVYSLRASALFTKRQAHSASQRVEVAPRRGVGR